MSHTDDLLERSRHASEAFEPGHLSRRPARNLLVLTCMDSRIDVFRILGLQSGEAHILRNAGGVVTEHELRAIAISQRAMGTREVVLIHHTDCGAHGLDEDQFKRELEEETGVRPTWPETGFEDLDEDVRQSIARVRESPFVPHRDSVRGFVYDVDTGRLREVS